MRHREAIECLSDLGSGSLDAATETALAAHAEGCAACREWLATRDLLARHLSRSGQEEPAHPPSDLLALCVVRPEEVDEPDHEELRGHLERCSECRRHLSLTRRAVRAARANASRATPPPRVPTPLASPAARRWIAASLAFFLLALAGVALHRSASRAVVVEAAAEDTTPVAAAPVEPPEEVSGRDLEGTQTIVSERELLVSQLTVNPAADVTFRAAQVVAFGDGFRVAEGARMRVETQPSPDDESSSTEARTGQ